MESDRLRKAAIENARTRFIAEIEALRKEVNQSFPSGRLPVTDSVNLSQLENAAKPTTSEESLKSTSATKAAEAKASAPTTPTPAPQAQPIDPVRRSRERAARTIQRRWRSRSADRAAQKDAINTIWTLRSRFEFLKTSFVPPQHLEFRDTSSTSTEGGSETPALSFNSANASVHAYINELMKLVMLADGVPSAGSDQIRAIRKAFVKMVEEALDDVDRMVRAAWEKMHPEVSQQGSIKIPVAEKTETNPEAAAATETPVAEPKAEDDYEDLYVPYASVPVAQAPVESVPEASAEVTVEPTITATESHPTDQSKELEVETQNIADVVDSPSSEPVVHLHSPASEAAPISIPIVSPAEESQPMTTEGSSAAAPVLVDVEVEETKDIEAAPISIPIVSPAEESQPTTTEESSAAASVPVDVDVEETKDINEETSTLAPVDEDSVPVEPSVHGTAEPAVIEPLNSITAIESELVLPSTLTEESTMTATTPSTPASVPVDLNVSSTQVLSVPESTIPARGPSPTTDSFDMVYPDSPRLNSSQTDHEAFESSVPAQTQVPETATTEADDASSVASGTPSLEGFEML
ncbi:hypothetical protein M422DRAFT_50658 [Sphaerobolus stellatus SS14]|uniref:BAG domain-containing protein n=1 Tax=Sphaerobolus stellatus (strain SS14) TaxID=990650 RepID=A0A0C9V620_SPHS4|nr:hypothetical protein M422DRAFT_50658 [Sphaerobolus stellatus SS14]